MINEIFGKLTVLEQVIISSEKKRKQYRCQCLCGNIVIVSGSKLKSKNNHCKSCPACAYANRPQFKNRLSPEERSFRLHIQDRAKKDNIECSLTVKQYTDVASRNCHYCNTAAISVTRDTCKLVPKRYAKLNGLDRVDSSGGYHLDNVVSCCKICNFAKGTLSEELFKEWITRVYKYFILKE
jgi:hypothetical protein